MASVFGTQMILMVVFFAGFAVMILEIVGVRYLAVAFGGSFYVWTSQIGMILLALAGGYYAGGLLADRNPTTRTLGLLLVPAGLWILLIPLFGAKILDAIVLRHPAAVDVPLLWRRLDPAMGSAFVFFLPCFALATIGPFMIRVMATTLDRVGRVAGRITAWSTLGSIAGVYTAGYLLVDWFGMATIFRSLGALLILLAVQCRFLDRFVSAGK